MNAERGLNWIGIVMSTAMLAVLSLIINSVISVVFGFYVGVQTRGDSEAIAQQLAAFTHSTLFLVVSALVMGLLIFWRGRAFARTTDQPLTHIVIVAVATLAVGFVLGMTLGGLPVGTLVAQGAVQLGVALAAGYASVSSTAAKPTTA